MRVLLNYGPVAVNLIRIFPMAPRKQTKDDAQAAEKKRRPKNTAQKAIPDSTAGDAADIALEVATHTELGKSTPAPEPKVFSGGGGDFGGAGASGDFSDAAAPATEATADAAANVAETAADSGILDAIAGAGGAVVDGAAEIGGAIIEGVGEILGGLSCSANPAMEHTNKPRRGTRAHDRLMP
jgi:hypothetical protein